MTECPVVEQQERSLDWNELWRKAVTRKWPDLENRARYWNRRAASFSRRSPDSLYTRAFLDLLAPEPHWSILDVGCGTGTLAIPLAGLVQQVTAMDFSEAMIEHLVRDCTGQGIRNIRALQAGWEDDWERAGIGLHDVAIASRSLVVENLEEAIRKLDQAARHRVYISCPVGDGPMDRRTLEALGRTFQKGPDYIYVYNLLHQIGIYAHIRILRTEEERTFDSPGEVLDFYRGIIEDLKPGEDERLCSYVADNLMPRDGRWALRGQQALSWALIWWEKDATCSRS